MRAFTASPAPPTPTSTSMPAATSSARSSSRSTRRSGRAPSCSSRPGSTSTWRSAPTPTRTSGSRSSTSCCRASGRRMRDSGTPCSVLTKSPLLLRDIELFKQIPDFARQPLDPDARREGVAGQRAAHAPPAQAHRGGGGAQPGGHPHRRPDRAADAGHQRLAGAGRAHPRALRRGGRGQRRRDLPAPARRGPPGRSWTGCAPTGPTWCRATRSCTRAAPTRRRRSASASRG